MLLSPGRQRRTELHGEAADRDRPQQGAPDGRHRPDPGTARRHQHEARQVIDNRDRPLRTPNRSVLRDYEPSDGPSFQALLCRELVWDEELAVVAQRWADQCMPGHDHRRNVGM